MPVIGVLTSCAMPAAMMPSDARRSFSSSLRSIATRSVMSLTTSTTAAPRVEENGATLAWIDRSRPRPSTMPSSSGPSFGAGDAVEREHVEEPLAPQRVGVGSGERREGEVRRHDAALVVEHRDARRRRLDDALGVAA